MTDRKFPAKREREMPSQSHTKAADHHESAAKSHRAAAEHHGKNDHMKGHEHAAEAKRNRIPRDYAALLRASFGPTFIVC